MKATKINFLNDIYHGRVNCLFHEMTQFRATTRWIVSVILVLLPMMLSGENIVVRGVVRDSITRNPVPFASVALTGTSKGVLTDEYGRYTIVSSVPFDSVVASALGYSTRGVRPKKGSRVKADIFIPSTGVVLGEVIARPHRQHYSKKNNPAVDFMERIRANQDLNDPRRHDNYNYDKYERINLAINDYQFNDSATHGIDKKFGFLKEYIDTSEISGKPILNVALREKRSSVHYRRDPESEKEYVTGLRNSGFDDMLDRQSTQTFYEDVLREVDVYSNDIVLLQNRFVSPLSRIAPDFYKFYLTDTLTLDSIKCAELTFVPRNSASMGFTGRFYVALEDSAMFIKRIVMSVPRDINLNFIDALKITQDYVRGEDGSRIKTLDDLMLEAKVLPGMPGIYGRRVTVYDNHNFSEAPDESIFKRGASQIMASGATSRPDDFWDENRMISIPHGEKSMEMMMNRLRSVPIFYWGEKIVKAFASGYVPTGNPSKFDFGPLTSTVSYNSVEGLRLRAGGITTANLSPRIFSRGYAAYGFKDHRWKYSGELEYSFRDKEYHSREFPVHSIRATHLYDLDRLGQISIMHNDDNMFLSFRRLPDREMTYHRVSKIEYIMETESHFSIEARFQNEIQFSTPFMTFTNGDGHSFGHYSLTALRLQLRYAPGEKFYQMKTGRLPINLDAPVFTLSHTIGPRGFMGNDFAVSITEASFSKRFWFSAFGYLDTSVKGGHVWTRSPYPNLLIPGSNLSYMLVPDLFSCLNPMEFINDSYLQWDLTYWANGTLLNLVPVLKKLKLREAISFKGVWGHLSKKNRPWLNSELYSFPEVAQTQLMTAEPYMELSAGLDNIFRVLRLDYAWRLNYRNNPQACKSGLRFTFHFTF